MVICKIFQDQFRTKIEDQINSLLSLKKKKNQVFKTKLKEEFH
jgi:hypothetical protein